MHLTDRQLDRFFELLDGLIVFANSRLNLVDGLRLPIVGEDAEMKAAYVCDTMWRHPEVVEEYVRVNPNGLRKADLDAVAAWSDALVGRFTLVRFERGRAILMNEAGLFAVAGLDDDPEKRMPQCPDMVVATLLPFEGLVVSDGLMYGDGIPFNEAETASMRESLAAHEGEGIAWTPEELLTRARAYNAKLREQEFDDLMTSLELEARQSREGERLPEGYHRGALAGLSAEEREERVAEHAKQLLASLQDHLRRHLSEQAAFAPPSESLEECLAVCLKRNELVDLCKRLDVHRYGNKNKRGIAAMLVAPISQAAQSLGDDLMVCSPQAFDLFTRVVEAGGRCEDDLDALDAHALPVPLVPYVFQFADDGKLTTVLPVELRPLVAKLDLETISYERDREDAAVNCAEAMGEIYGLLTLREAYELYHNAVVDAYTLEEFVGLLMREDSFDDLGFVLQQWNGDSYLMHYSASDVHLNELVARRYEGEVRQSIHKLFVEGMDGPTMTALQKRMQADVDAERVELDRYRARVIEVRARMPRRPLDAAAAEGTTFERYAALPAMVQLRDFYDEHVPDAEDDFTFADRAVEDLMTHAIDLGDVDGYLNALEDAGWNACCEDPNLYQRLVENAYGAMPSWEFNGWSPQEVLENMSGRKVFYNARGEMLHPAPGDPCPCGSGKPYSSCHGAS